MTPRQAAKEIVALLKEAEDVTAPSAELRAFLDDLAKSPGLKKPRVNRRTTAGGGTSVGTTPRVGERTKRPTEVEMAQTIEELAKKLNDAFNSDERFEAVMTEVEAQPLTKSNVVTLYQRVFKSARAPSTSLTKPELFNALRKARIKQVRGQS